MLEQFEPLGWGAMIPYVAALAAGTFKLAEWFFPNIAALWHRLIMLAVLIPPAVLAQLEDRLEMSWGQTYILLLAGLISAFVAEKFLPAIPQGKSED